MTPPISIGDEVEIIGLNSINDNDNLGDRFKITQIWLKNGEVVYSGECMAGFLASSLRLGEEELKIGDWVQVIGPSRYGFVT